MENLKTHIMHGLYSIDHNIEYRQIVEVASDWFLDKYNMQDPEMTIKMNLTNSKTLKCWGESFQVDSGLKIYSVSIATDQYLRDFIATLMHELVHVYQWERGEWEDDGEKEAEDKQYELADEFWKEGLIR
tara:strand:+ start:882 stop:1271 length:390 start_codon:yes stop_codon:yes gene_type:complete